jgi:prepilin-type N-terminal cleavage/methylation domain-containing protein
LRRTLIPRKSGGFTLVEISVALAIVALLLAGFLFTLSTQLEQRNFTETRRRLDTARELLLSYAIVNGRLPCPAVGGTTGDEAPLGGGICTAPYNGWLPARTIGYQDVDPNGYALDAYGNRIRYAVAMTVTGCAATPVMPYFTNTTNLKSNGVTCQPSDLVICQSANGITTTTCGTANSATNQNIVVAIVFSVGKNGALGAGGVDEAANLDNNPVFVSHPPAPAGAAGGEFDDSFVWISVGELYGRLIAAGVLP